MPCEGWVRQQLPDVQDYPPLWYIAQDVSRDPDNVPAGANRHLVSQNKTIAARTGSAAESRVAALPCTTPVDTASPYDPLAALATVLQTAEEDCSGLETDNNNPRPETMTNTASEGTVSEATDTSIVVHTGCHRSRKSKSTRQRHQAKTDQVQTNISSICGDDHTTWLPDYAIPTETVDITDNSDRVVLKEAQHWPTLLLKLVANLAASTNGDLSAMHECTRQAYDILQGHRRSIIKGSTTTGALYELIRRACDIASEVARTPSVALVPVTSTYTLRRSRVPSAIDNDGEEDGATRRTTRGSAMARCNSYYDEDDEESFPTVRDHRDQEDNEGQQSRTAASSVIGLAPKRIKIETNIPLTPALTHLATPSDRSGPVTGQSLPGTLNIPHPTPIPTPTPLVQLSADPGPNINTIAPSPDVEDLAAAYEIAVAKLAVKETKVAWEAARRRR
ncbi:hypothetical protein LTR86_004461 [Recurvomyces mirabilis]|nr:hypothetical protein LTR86_004461 [Recurvomyces mirabilis]